MSHRHGSMGDHLLLCCLLAGCQSVAQGQGEGPNYITHLQESSTTVGRWSRRRDRRRRRCLAPNWCFAKNREGNVDRFNVPCRAGRRGGTRPPGRPEVVGRELRGSAGCARQEGSSGRSYEVTGGVPLWRERNGAVRRCWRGCPDADTVAVPLQYTSRQVVGGVAWAVTESESGQDVRDRLCSLRTVSEVPASVFSR